MPLICARELDIDGAHAAVHPGADAPRRPTGPRPSCTTSTSRARGASATTCPELSDDAPGRADVVGTGLIGGSIGLALRAGLARHRPDRDAGRADAGPGARRARRRRARPRRRDHLRRHAGAARSPTRPRARSPTTAGVVTDVGSVKAPIVDAVDDPRFVGGHPMAGSEQEGVDGADADLFEGAVWVLTPTAATDDARVRRGALGRRRRSAPRSSRCRPTATTRWSRSCRTCPTSPRPR